MNDLGPVDGGPADVVTIAELIDVPVPVLIAEWERAGCPAEWTLPAEWARVALRRVQEAAAHVGVYDAGAAAAWHAGQARGTAVRV